MTQSFKHFKRGLKKRLKKQAKRRRVIQYTYDRATYGMFMLHEPLVVGHRA